MHIALRLWLDPAEPTTPYQGTAEKRGKSRAQVCFLYDSKVDYEVSPGRAQLTQATSVVYTPVVLGCNGEGH